MPNPIVNNTEPYTPQETSKKKKKKKNDIKNSPSPKQNETLAPSTYYTWHAAGCREA